MADDETFRSKLANVDERDLKEVVKYVAEYSCVEEVEARAGVSHYPTEDCYCTPCVARRLQQDLWPVNGHAQRGLELFRRVREIDSSVLECQFKFIDENKAITTHSFRKGGLV